MQQQAQKRVWKSRKSFEQFSFVTWLALGDIQNKHAMGALKMLDVKMTDVKLTDQFAGHEIAGHEIDGPMYRT